MASRVKASAADNMPRLRAIAWIAVSSKVQATHDKISLGEQERLIREYCEREDYDIVDVLSVPGHSRSESDIITALEELAVQGCYAYHKLRERWKARNFDCLIAFDNSRFARSQSLHAFVIENTIRAGATIHLIQGGDITEDNVEMGIALGGISATSGIKRTVKMRDAAMIGRASRGLTMTGVPFTHRLIRDVATGKALYLELREELRPVFDDAAVLLLEGIGWKQFSLEMARRFGHLNPDTGDAYHDEAFKRYFYGPYTWGAAAKGFAHKYGPWAFDETAPIPEGVIVSRKPNPPVPAVYSGEQGELIKAELLRRWSVGHGRAVSRSQYPFTGLLVCQQCGRRMGVESSRKAQRGYYYWRCPRREKYLAFRGRQCSNTLMLPNAVAQEQINDFLVRLLKLKQPDITSLSKRPSDSFDKRAVQINANILTLNKQLDNLITRQTTAPENVQDRYTKQIQEASYRLEALQKELLQVQRQVEPENVQINRRLAYKELVEIGLDAFWQWEPHKINQLLHRLMGKHRFACLGKEIVDIV